MEKVGKEGVITVDEGKSTESVLEYTEGMQFDKGYLSPYFLTNPTTLEAVLEDCLHPASTRRRSRNLAELLPLLNKIVTSGKPLLIIAEDVESRGAGGAGGQQAARRAERLRRQGPGLRRSPQGHDGRHRRRHRRQVHQRGPGPEARERRAGRPRPGQAHRHRQGQHADHRRRRQEEGHRRPRRPDPQADREDHQRLRPREAPGAPGEAHRRRGRHQGRRRPPRPR